MILRCMCGLRKIGLEVLGTRKLILNYPSDRQLFALSSIISSCLGVRRRTEVGCYVNRLVCDLSSVASEQDSESFSKGVVAYVEVRPLNSTGE